MESDRVDGWPPSREVVALAALSLGAFAYVTAESLPIGLLGPMADGLGVSRSAVGLLVTAYGLVVVAVTLPLTRAARRLPRRRVMTVLLLVFTVTTVVAGSASTYWVVVAARAATACSQALFWALVVPTALGIVPSHRRGMAVTTVFSGVSLASVAGVPAASWLGATVGWRPAFMALAAVAAASMVAIRASLPAQGDAASSAEVGAHPDPTRYRTLVIATALATVGAFTAYTYVTAFLTDVSGLAARLVGLALLVRGVAGTAGVVLGGRLLGRRAIRAVPAILLLQTFAFVGLSVIGGIGHGVARALGGTAVTAVALVAVAGLAFSALTAVLAGEVFDIAPASPDLAAAGISTAVNSGIAIGAFVGGLLLSSYGPQGTVVSAALVSAVAFAVLRIAPRPTRRTTSESQCRTLMERSGV